MGETHLNKFNNEDKKLNYILKNENAIYYECEYSNDNSIFLSIEGVNYLFTDGRYAIEANPKNAEVIIDRDILASAIKIIKESKIKKIYFDPKEWCVYSFDKLSSDTKVNFKAEIDFSHKKRIIKRADEIKKLKRAVVLGSDAFDKFSDYLSSDGYGKDEYKLNLKAKEILSYEGKYELSFDPIVAIAQNSAKPHALPTPQILNKKDLILVDAGLKYQRYCSDRTRVAQVRANMDFSLSQDFGTGKKQKIYDTVAKARDMAIARAKSGMRAKDIDKIARSIIEKAGYGEYFVHSTGHGVGLDIHEMPYISSKSETIIEDGMIFTIEPGIYIPNKFGVRIEDMVVMKNGKVDIL